MNKTTLLILLILALVLAGCSGNETNAADPSFSFQDGAAPSGDATQNGAATELSIPMQVALGTLKLDGTDHAVAAEQASELLPLWQTLQVLYDSDTAATEEISALVEQIQETMTSDQMQAITALNLTRQDMFSIMQTQGMGSSQTGTTQRAGTTTNNGSGLASGGGGFAGGPPPGGAIPLGEDPNFQDQMRSSQSSSATDSTTRPAAMDPNRIPTPLIQGVIDYLISRSGT